MKTMQGSLVAATAIFLGAATLAAAQTQSNTELILEIQEFKQAVIDKMNSDAETTARAFADAQNLQRSLRWTDIFQPVLEIIRAVYTALSVELQVKNPYSALSWVNTAQKTANSAMEFWSAGLVLD